MQAHLVLFLAVGDARKRAFDDEGAEVFAVDLGEHDEQIGEAAVGDPHLFAAQHEAAVGLARRARLCAERIGARSRFAERVGADHLARQQPRQVLLLLRFRAEQQNRQHREVRLRAERGAERGRPRQPLADDQRRHFVELNASVCFGDVDAEQPELSAALDELSSHGPILRLETIELRQHFLLHELVGRLSDQPVFLREPLGREHRVGLGRLEKPGAAAENRRWSRGACRHC